MAGYWGTAVANALLLCLCVFRPLTQEEIAQRREVARQRHAERMMADQAAPEGHKNLPSSAGPAPKDPSKGEMIHRWAELSGTSDEKSNGTNYLLEINPVTIPFVLIFTQYITFFSSYCRESDLERLPDGTGRRAEGGLHCICAGLQQSGQERPKSVCAWAKVWSYKGPDFGKPKAFIQP